MNESRTDRLMLRVGALEARCHELEHDRAAGVQEQIADLQERVKALEAMTGATTAEYAWVIPRDAPSEVRYAPVDSPWVKRQVVMDHRDAVPVPAEPAIPDVPTPVGTDAFREALAGHMQELSGAYSWGAEHHSQASIDTLERLAGVACTLRDAYDLARIGENEEAEERLKEIEW